MNRIRELRIEKELTQKELAACLGLTANCICEWEKGRSEPGIESLQKLVACFGCSIDYLVGIEDDFGNVVVQSNSSTTPNLSPDEKKLLDTYRALDMKNRMHVSAYAEIRLEEQSKEKQRRTF